MGEQLEKGIGGGGALVVVQQRWTEDNPDKVRRTYRICHRPAGKLDEISLPVKENMR